MGRPVSDPLDRLLERVVVSPDGCWLWPGRVDRDGYVRIWTKGKQRAAHRVIYERVAGAAITSGLVIDHLCRVRHCLRPSHLDLTTPEENVARGASCRCGTCPKCRRNAYMRRWYAQRKPQPTDPTERR